MKFLLLVLFALGSLTTATRAQLSDSNMIKIVFRDTSPGITEPFFGAKPKTLYRVGHTYGRMEEMLDADQGIHGLMIVAEPKMWMIDLVDSTGRMMIDPGPTFNFQAPVAKVDSKRGLMPLKEFEFGTEYDYLISHKAKASTALVSKVQYDQLTLDIEGYTIVLLSHKDTRKPFRVTITAGSEIYCQFDYVEYQAGLDKAMDLFKPPSWAKITQ